MIHSSSCHFDVRILLPGNLPLFVCSDCHGSDGVHGGDKDVSELERRSVQEEEAAAKEAESE